MSDFKLLKEASITVTTADTFFTEGDTILVEQELFVIGYLQHDYHLEPFIEHKEVKVLPYTKPKNCGKRLRSTAKRPKRGNMELHPTKGWRIIGK